MKITKLPLLGLFCGLLTAGLCPADTQPLELVLKASSATLPIGGSTQIQVFSTRPVALVRGALTLTFDAGFGAIANVDVFSATGDQLGYSKVTGNRVDLVFSSASGGIGRLPGEPIAVVNVAAVGGGSVTLTSDSTWEDAPGQAYAVAGATASFPAAAGPSIESVSLVGNPLKIIGRGFTPDMKAQIDGVAITASTGTATEIDLTLGSALELTGRRISLGGISYFPGIHDGPTAAPGVDSTIAAVQPVFPTVRYSQGLLGSGGSQIPGALVVQNPTASPVELSFVATDLQVRTVRTNVTLAPGGVYWAKSSNSQQGLLFVSAAVPVRMLNLFFSSDTLRAAPAGVAQTGNAFQATFDGQLALPTFLLGSPAPPPTTHHVVTNGPSIPFQISVGSEAAGWLKLSPASGMTCDATQTAACGDASQVTFSVDPSKLAAGVYPAQVSISVSGTNVYGSTATISLVVLPTIFSVSGSNGNYLVTSTPTGISFAPSISVADGLGGVSVSPSIGTTPAPVTVTNHRVASLPDTTARLLISGGGTSLAYSIDLPSPYTRFLVPPTVGYTIRTSEARRFLGIFQGIAPQLVGIPTVSVKTDDGGNWLEATVTPGRQLVFYGNAADNHLVEGDYGATVRVEIPDGLSVTMRVTLKVVATLPDWVRISVFTPWQFTAPAHSVSAAMPVDIDFGGLPLFARIQTPAFLQLVSDPKSYSFGVPNLPGTLRFVATGQTVGTYTGNIEIDVTQAYIGSGAEGEIRHLTLPVVYTVTPNLTPPATSASAPFLNTLVNGASAVSATVAPGEIITMYGQGLDSPTSLLFNGFAAQLLYSNSAQVNAILPFELGANGTAKVEIVQAGGTTTLAILPTAFSAPGIFTLNSSGVGPGAVLNQDLSVNLATNPAVVGSIVAIYATGGGLPSPPQPVRVFIGGKEATITYAGQAPQSVAGLLQVNAVVPGGISVGPAVPVILQIGESISPAFATIAVQ